MRSVAISILLAAGPVAAAPVDPAADLVSQRDALIDRITRGVDYERSVREFKALYQKRAALVGAVVAVQQQAEDRAAEDRKQAQQRAAAREARSKTADHEASWRCTLSPDPAHPVPSDEGRFRADWGKVTRREQVRLAPRNALDDGELVTMFEVAGVAEKLRFEARALGGRDRPFDAAVGDLVLVCAGSRDTDGRLPPAWAGSVIKSGVAFRVAAPPRIAAKRKWNPRHVTGTRFFWAIKDVKWKYPPEEFVLSYIEIGKDLGDGRFEIPTNNDLSWVMEVPKRVAKPHLLKPGSAVWAILGQHRFDRGLKKLVLVAEDLEERYVEER